MTEFNVHITKNTLVDRLRVLHSRLTNENEHSEAIFVDMAIQVLSSPMCPTTNVYVNGPIDAAALAAIRRAVNNDPSFLRGDA